MNVLSQRVIKYRVVSFLLIVLFLLPLSSPAAKKVNLRGLDRYIGEAVKTFELPGLAIAVVHDGQVVFSKTYGFKNIEAKEKVAETTLFNIASLSKAFTAACVAKLVEQGKLGWDDRVIDYMPEFRLSDPYITRELTIRDILSHRVGFGTFDGDLLWYHTNYDTKEILRRVGNMPVTRRFRDQFGYQNNMYILAGEIVERVSGKTWAEFLEEHILKPLEMTSSRANSKMLEKNADLALPYSHGEKYPIYIQDSNPAASIYSSTSEMTHWMRMLLEGGKYNGKQVLEAKTLDTLFTPQLSFQVSGFQKKHGTQFRGYGLGWGVSDYYGNKVVEHSGGMPGYISLLTLVPGKKIGIVTLTNGESSVNRLLKNKILDLFLRKKAKTDWMEIFQGSAKKRKDFTAKRDKKRLENRAKNTRPSLPLKDYTGIYEDKVYGKASITLGKKGMVISLLPAKEIFTSTMEHWHYDTFKFLFKDNFLPFGLATFTLDSNGKVKGFTIDLPNGDFHFHHLDFEWKEAIPGKKKEKKEKKSK